MELDDACNVECPCRRCSTASSSCRVLGRSPASLCRQGCGSSSPVPLGAASGCRGSPVAPIVRVCILSVKGRRKIRKAITAHELTYEPDVVQAHDSGHHVFFVQAVMLSRCHAIMLSRCHVSRRHAGICLTITRALTKWLGRCVYVTICMSPSTGHEVFGFPSRGSDEARRHAVADCPAERPPGLRIRANLPLLSSLPHHPSIRSLSCPPVPIAPLRSAAHKDMDA